MKYRFTAREDEEDKSLSSRRAWIEMNAVTNAISCFRSLSSRRAWIEIANMSASLSPFAVALLTEGVD